MSHSSVKLHAQAGFTLLELLIALVLTGLLTVLVYGGLQVGISSWEKVIDRNEEITDAFLTQRFLRRLLESSRGETVMDINNEDSSVAFLGLESELLFVASLPRFERRGELLWIYLSIDNESEEFSQLQMVTAPFEPEQPVDWDTLLAEFRSAQESDRYVLVSGVVQEIGFQYLEIEEEGFDDWQSQWRFQTQLPAAIQMGFIADSTELRWWPDLVVIPREYAYGIKDAP